MTPATAIIVTPVTAIVVCCSIAIISVLAAVVAKLRDTLSGEDWDEVVQLSVRFVRRRFLRRSAAHGEPDGGGEFTSRSVSTTFSVPVVAPGCLRWYRLVVLVSKLMPSTGREEYLASVNEGLGDCPEAEHAELLHSYMASAASWVWEAVLEAGNGRARAVRRAVAGASDRERPS